MSEKRLSRRSSCPDSAAISPVNLVTLLIPCADQSYPREAVNNSPCLPEGLVHLWSWKHERCFAVLRWELLARINYHYTSFLPCFQRDRTFAILGGERRWVKDCWARSLFITCTCCSCSKANAWVTPICTLRLFTAHVIRLGKLRSSICPKIRLFSFWLVSKMSDSQLWGKHFYLVKIVK